MPPEVPQQLNEVLLEVFDAADEVPRNAHSNDGVVKAHEAPERRCLPRRHHPQNHAQVRDAVHNCRVGIHVPSTLSLPVQPWPSVLTLACSVKGWALGRSEKRTWDGAKLLPACFLKHDSQLGGRDGRFCVQRSPASPDAGPARRP